MVTIASDAQADGLILAWLKKMSSAQEIQAFFKPYPVYGEDVMTSTIANGFLLLKSGGRLNDIADLHNYAPVGGAVLTNLRIHAKEAIALWLLHNQTVGSPDELYLLNKEKNREGVPLNELIVVAENQSRSVINQQSQGLWKSLMLEFQIPFVSLLPVAHNGSLLPEHFAQIRYQSWAVSIHQTDYRWVAQVQFAQNQIKNIQIIQSNN